MIHLSASTIKDLMICPKRVFYRRSKQDASSTDEQGVGSAVHHITETKWQKRDREFEKAISLSYAIDEAQLPKFDRCLSNFYHQHSSLLESTDLIEYKFNIQIDDDLSIVGKMDRVSVNSGIVIDWKTSEVVPVSIENDVQFILYYWAFQKLFHTNPTVLLINLARNKVVEYVPNEQSISVLFKRVIPQCAQMIRREIYPDFGIFNKACPNCSYQSICLGR